MAEVAGAEEAAEVTDTVEEEDMEVQEDHMEVVQEDRMAMVQEDRMVVVQGDHMEEVRQDHPVGDLQEDQGDPVVQVVLVGAHLRDLRPIGYLVKMIKMLGDD